VVPRPAKLAVRRRELPVATVAAILAEVVRGRPRYAAVFSGLHRERVKVYPLGTRLGVCAAQLLGGAGFGSKKAHDEFVVALPTPAAEQS
jgi:hypothetical protein